MQIIYHHTTGSWMSKQLQALSGEAGLNVVAVAPHERDRLDKALADAEVIWHVLEPLTADEISAAPRLRLIQKIGVGVNTIDVAAASARGIAVCNMPETNSRAVAEMTIALMLNCLRRLTMIHDRTRMGSGWGLPPDTFEACGEISGRTVGLVGYGAVPRILAPILVALGARVIYTATSPKEDSVGVWRTLTQVLAESDIVSLHVPLTDDTARMLDRDALALMKQGAILINTARGELVDQTALIDALTADRLAAAGLDVFAPEPIRPDDPILSIENVVLTPHVAWQTRETLTRSLEAATENCRRLRAGEPLLDQVNSPSG
jgi:phosphoglycerate dehydrogenase-like enzyme